MKLKARPAEKIEKCWHFNRAFMPLQMHNHSKPDENVYAETSFKKRIMEQERVQTQDAHTRNKPRIFHRIIALLLFPQRVNFTILLTFIDFLRLEWVWDCAGMCVSVCLFCYRCKREWMPCRRPTNSPRLHITYIHRGTISNVCQFGA